MRQRERNVKIARDRQKKVEVYLRDRERGGGDFMLSSSVDTYMPVSYTHLDVYKRQVFTLRHWPVSYGVYFIRIHANTRCRNQMAQLLYFLLE